MFYPYSFGYAGTVYLMVATCLYAFVYRPVIDFARLIALGILKRSDYKTGLGFGRFKYYKELMFGMD